MCVLEIACINKVISDDTATLRGSSQTLVLLFANEYCIIWYFLVCSVKTENRTVTVIINFSKEVSSMRDSNFI